MITALVIASLIVITLIVVVIALVVVVTTLASALIVTTMARALVITASSVITILIRILTAAIWCLHRWERRLQLTRQGMLCTS